MRQLVLGVLLVLVGAMLVSVVALGADAGERLSGELNHMRASPGDGEGAVNARARDHSRFGRAVAPFGGIVEALPKAGRRFLSRNRSGQRRGGPLAARFQLGEAGIMRLGGNLIQRGGC